MRTQSPDTTPEAEAIVVGLYRSAPPWRKMAIVEDITKSVRLLAIAGLAHRHPGASTDELRRRLAGLILGEELAEKAYGPLRASADPRK